MTPLDTFLAQAKAKHAILTKGMRSDGRQAKGLKRAPTQAEQRQFAIARRELCYNTYPLLLRIVEAQADLLRRAEPTIVGTEAWTLALADVAAIVEGAGK